MIHRNNDNDLCFFYRFFLLPAGAENWKATIISMFRDDFSLISKSETSFGTNFVVVLFFITGLASSLVTKS